MGLDIYVGSFTRYYAGDWELVASRVAREIGAQFEVIRKNDAPDAIRDPEQIRPLVLEWRNNLSESLAESLPKPLDWNEGPDAPYSTDKPAWDGYNALLLWAAYEEHPNLRIPEVVPENLLKAPAFLLSTSEDFKTRYPALLSGAQIWFPADFSFVFKAPDCAGREVTFGSAIALARQLDELNKRTWNLDDAEANKAAIEGFEYGGPLEVGARFAFSLFRRHAAFSVTHQLPMLLQAWDSHSVFR